MLSEIVERVNCNGLNISIFPTIRRPKIYIFKKCKTQQQIFTPRNKKKTNLNPKFIGQTNRQTLTLSNFRSTYIEEERVQNVVLYSSEGIGLLEGSDYFVELG